jgi:hypothetical protein
MKRNKKLLVSFLALNAVLSSYATGATTASTPKYERMYSNIVKNIEKGSSNEKTYQVIERILKQKNKELKDLYLQSDYILKPEYLEWQVFFSAGYEEYGKGVDNSSDNAKYNSKVTGYYDTTGNYVVTSGNKGGIFGKPYQPLQMPKEINLGVNIPISGISRDPLDLAINPKTVTVVAPSQKTVPAPNPNVVILNLNGIEIPTAPVPPGGLGSSGVILNPSIVSIVNPLFTTNPVIINSSNLDTDGANDGYYVFQGSNESIEFTGTNNVIGSKGALLSTNTSTIFTNLYVKNSGILNVSDSSAGDAPVGIQHETANVGNLIFENTGKINVSYGTNMSAERLFFEGSVELRNKSGGEIIFKNENGNNMKELYATANSYASDPNPMKIINDGIITVEGISSIPYSKTVMAHHYGHLTSSALGQHTIINNGIINLKNALGYLQDYSTGIYDASGGGIMNVRENSVGIELTLSGISEPVFNSSTLKVGTINVEGSTNTGSQYSKGINMLLDAFPTMTVNISDGEINLESNSMGIITNIPGNQTINNSAEINISGENSYGIITYTSSSSSGSIENTGDITLDVTNTSKLSAGIFHQIAPSFVNKGNIYVKSTGSNAEGTIGILLSQGAKFTNDGGGTKVISVDGRKATGVFANQNTTNTIKDTAVKVTNSGIGFFSYNGSDIKLENITAEASAGGILFYSSSTPSISKITFVNSSSATVKDGGTAFYVDGPLTGIPASYINLNNLNLKMEDGSTVFLLDSPGTYSIGALPTASMAGLNIDPFSGNYKDVTINRGTINIDNIGGNQIFDLNNANDALNKNSFYSSNLNLITGSTIQGSQSGQLAMGQTSYTGAASNTLVTLTNDGTIQLSGTSSIGMYANYGTLNNNTAISATGTDSVGMYGENGTAVINLGSITIGNKGIGIYGISNQNILSPASYGDQKVNITNNASVVSGGGTSGTVGIYANSNAGVPGNNLILGTGSNINLGASDSAIGIYVNQIDNVQAAGTITVGSNGIGMYANNSNVTINNLTINLNGDNSLGYYIDGNSSSFTGTGTINIDGQNITLFSINSNSPTVDFSGITVGAVTAGSNYTLGSLVNGKMTYGSSALLATNGTMLNGKNTNIYLNGSSDIKAEAGATGVVAVALEGQYTAGTPITPGIDGKNDGQIVLGNSSVGLYGKNDARFENTNIITVGDDSAGIYTEGTFASINNTGTITIGSNSQGVYLKNGDKIDNGGSIVSSGVSTVGIFADNVLKPVINTGIIDLSGDRSVGIYKTGAVNSISNTNIIKIGVSSDLNDPGIGIYSNTVGDIITNSGIIDAGKNSIGIYAEGAAVNQNNVLSVGDTGTGIYTKGGTVTLGTGSNVTVGSNESVGIYGTNGTYIINNSTNAVNINNGGYGFILETSSLLDNHGILSLNGKGTGVYSNGLNTVNNHTGADINMSGDNNIGIYMVSGGIINNDADINGAVGKSNIGIYNKNGTINNTGTINVGDSVLAYKSDGTVDYDNSGYAVGIYGDGSYINNTGNINVRENGIGLYTRNNPVKVVNKGSITGTGKGAVGIFVDNGVAENDYGVTITMTGDDSIGMVANKNGTITNNGNIIMAGNNVSGMFANINSKAVNNGTINMSGAAGDKSTAFLLGAGSTFENNGILILGSNAVIAGVAGETYKIPSIVNGGVIYSDGVLAADGISLSIKVNPESVVYQSLSSGPQFTANGTSIIADTLITDKPIVILPGFADGTNADVYKIENAVVASGGNYEFVSGSLLWEATPEATGTGANVYMERKSFTGFTDGLWFEDFGNALEKNFLGSTGDAMKIYNKTAYIQTEKEFRQVMGSMAGNVYSNINQREYDMAKALEESLHLLQDSSNNTKENVKISVIAGKGKNKEETDGVTGYDYAMTGILALREVERTYRHTFGYSLGYLHTGFEFKDGNESEEWVDTIQLGIHNKYTLNNWLLRNDITGRASIHNVDRNLNWPSPLEKSKMDGSYETYSITSDNILGKEFEIGKKASIMPYGAFKAMYVTRPKFNEKGLEALEVEGNDAWSAKPRAGVELKGAVPLGANTAWQLKGTLDFAYEYELADLNEREKARLVSIEDGYHKLSKPQDEKGTFRTRAAIGLEVEDRYGIFLTGEYSTGNDKEDDYRAGVTLKAVF